jgi:hypothetical protein
MLEGAITEDVITEEAIFGTLTSDWRARREDGLWKGGR